MKQAILGEKPKSWGTFPPTRMRFGGACRFEPKSREVLL